ncbi:MAG TPA: class I SAM-dependent methyltransferase [Stellaceae bacterium]|nr:class I SAM-dependent methyltransferase [Stellaceae bacterium]
MTDATGWTAAFAPASLSRREVEHRIALAFGRAAIPDRLARFSVMGTSLDLSDLTSDKLHMLAGLDARFKRAAILGESPVLYATESVCCWLGSLLSDMGPEGELWIQIPRPRDSRQRGHITPHFLDLRFAHGSVARTGRWTVLKHPRHAPGAPPPGQTIYRFFHRRPDQFLDWYMRDLGGNWTDESRRRALNTYIYSLYGIFYRDFLFERICQSHQLTGIKRILDVGGGLGFFAAERAAHGDQVTVVDHNARYLATARRLFAHCQVADRVSILHMPMEALDGLTAKYDVITFFNSLYYADKNVVAKILCDAYDLLAPGGVTIILENPKEAGDMKHGNYEYDVAFSISDFLSLMEPFGERVAYWRTTTGTRTDPPRQAAQLVASIAKPK